MSVLGTRVERREDHALLVGDSRYVADVPIEGAAHVAFVRSAEAHAVIVDIHTADAASMPGVVAIVSGSELGMAPRPPMLPDIDTAFSRPALAHERVRYVGEPVAVVIAETAAQAADAAEAVWVETEPLPPVLDAVTSAQTSTLLFPDAGTNVFVEYPAASDADPLDGADVVVRHRIANPRMASAPMEPRVIAAIWDGRRMTVHASTQAGFGLRATLAGILGLEIDDVRVLYQDVGGGFGAKGTPHPEELIVVWLAREFGRPLRWAESRSENLSVMGHGRGQVHDAAIGATADGRIVGLDIQLVQDGGAYPFLGCILPRLTLLMAVGNYDIPTVRLSARTVATNTAPVGAYRGAGRPEAAHAIERLVDALADELGIDPVELRRLNFIAPDAFPLTTASGGPYDSGDYDTALTRVVDAIGYEHWRAEQSARRERGDRRLLGIGVACYVEISAGAPAVEGADVRLDADGGVTVSTGSAPQGQGHLTTWAMVASDALGVALDRVRVETGDTDSVPEGTVVGGSRSAQSLGSTVLEASRAFVEAAKPAAADLLEAAVEDIEFDPATGRFSVVGTPAVSTGWDDLAAHGHEHVAVEYVSQGRPGSIPFGAHAVVVEVDAETGYVSIERLVALDDCGRQLNPLIVEGQVHGGIAAGLGQALFEEVVYDDAGNPITTNFADYSIAAASELPSFDRLVMETPSPNNPLGAKGIGESGTIGAMPAVVNAVVDALSHLGVRHLDTPLTPERVWSAIRDAERSG